MKLSVSMIVKNEEKYLDRTLKALKLISDIIETEIIVVDTGSTDETVNIAKKYTDKVFFKEWTGNFAEMRNESIKYATGEWILIIDADEELIDCSKFIDFINSPNSNQYNTCVIKLRNFLNESLTKVTDAPMPRLFKNDGKFKYEGRIHEQPLYKAPVYTIPEGVMVFNHYGYIYEDESIRQRKMKRNEELLLKELEENPNDPYMNYQLGQNFMVLNNLNEAIHYLEKSVYLYSKNKKVYIPAIVKLASSYLFTGENVKAEKECLKYLKTDKKNIDIYYYLAVAQYRMSKFNESILNFDKYFYYMNNYSQSTQATNMACNCETMKYKSKAVIYSADSLIKNKKYDKAKEVLSYISKDDEDVSDIYPTLIEISLKTESYGDILEYLDNNVNSLINRRAFLNSLETSLSKIRVEDKDAIYSTLSKIGGNYGKLNEARLNKKSFDILPILNNEVDFYYGELVDIYIKENNSYEEILLNVDRSKLYGYLKYIYSINKNYIDRFYSDVISLNFNYSFDYMTYRLILIKSLMDSKGLSMDRMNRLFKVYLFDRYRVIRFLYSKEIKDDNLLKLVVDKDDYLAIKFKILWENRDTDKVGFVKLIKGLIVDYPNYKSEIENIIKSYVEFIKNNSDSNSLKKEYIDIINKFYSEMNWETYFKLVDEYSELNPDDLEILPHIFTKNIIEGNINESMLVAWRMYIEDGFNYDNLFNMACVLESIDKSKALELYSAILRESIDDSLLNDVMIKIDEINKG